MRTIEMYDKEYTSNTCSVCRDLWYVIEHYQRALLKISKTRRNYVSTPEARIAKEALKGEL